MTMLQSLARIITIALFILTFIVQPFRIPSASMERTLLVGDFLLVNKQVYGPPGLWPHPLPYRNIQRGEIIVFYYPVDPSLHLVKRVVGLPGDRLHLVNGRVFVNGVALHEPYAVYRPTRADNYRDNFPQMEEADPAIETRWWIQMRSLVQDGELTVPPGDYFVMGDNGMTARTAATGASFHGRPSRASRCWSTSPCARLIWKSLCPSFLHHPPLIPCRTRSAGRARCISSAEADHQCAGSAEL